MKYKIVFDSSSDRYSAKRLFVLVASNELPAKIAQLQLQGRIVYSVSQVII